MSKTSEFRDYRTGNYGPEFVVTSAKGTDWKLKIADSVGVFPPDLKAGMQVTFDMDKRTEGKYENWYVTKIISFEGGGQQATPQTQQRVSTAPSSKDRQIFIQGLFQQSIMGAAAAGVSEEVSDDWYRRVEKYWDWFNNPITEKPGDAPANGGQNNYEQYER